MSKTRVEVSTNFSLALVVAKSANPNIWQDAALVQSIESALAQLKNNLNPKITVSGSYLNILLKDLVDPGSKNTTSGIQFGEVAKCVFDTLKAAPTLDISYSRQDTNEG